jgi:hypothetical protein
MRETLKVFLSNENPDWNDLNRGRELGIFHEANL